MRPIVLSFLFVLGLAAGACSSSSSGTPSRAVPPDEARTLLLDRNWLDKMPENDRDRLHVYRFVPSMGGGVFQDRTLFKGTFELFMFETTEGQIRFVLPETKEKVTSEFRIENVDGPEPFDLKLTITDDPRGPKVYFGIRSETDKDGARLERTLANKRSQLVH
ncbi:MAG: hypothetical protein H0T89_28300 [Deltaproteobacteria bacterium]|nr:hypothetical protein [Deltaproteobacteria bacterium]MDQ3296855.1 hypothetical protein [Myxococcota bacterium]